MWNSYGNMMGNWGCGSALGSVFSGFFMIIFWILIIWLIVKLARGDFDRSDANSFNDSKEGSSMSILKERYAKGEISKDEFEQMKKDLQ